MEDYLCHHGVPGMKWGKRKQKVSSGTRKNTTSSSKKTKQISKQKIKKIAETSALFVGKAALGVALGAVGFYAFDQVVRAYGLQHPTPFKDGEIHRIISPDWTLNKRTGTWYNSESSLIRKR